MDEIIRAISGDGHISISVISSPELVERARLIHGSTPVVTQALGMSLVAASIIGSALKKPDASLTVHINGGGTAGNIVAVSDSEGYVRGSVQNPLADSPDVKSAVGEDGVLSVIKDFGGKEPYTGSSRLLNGQIAKGFEVYFAQSEQIPCSCSFVVLIDSGMQVKAAGGFILQLLPGAHGAAIGALEARAAAKGQVTDALKSGGIEKLLQSVASDLNARVLERRVVGYRCTCSRDRFLASLLSLGKGDLEGIGSSGTPVETSCPYCKAVYVFQCTNGNKWH